jgi:cyclophilin family peptidyl-prolyl cis-trans isomerase
LLVLAGCGSSSSSSNSGGGSNNSPSSTSAGTATKPGGTTSAPGQPTNPSPVAPGGCTSVSAPSPKPQPHLAAPHTKLNPAKTYTVTVTTNCGTFAFTLDVKDSPKTSASIDYLAKRGFYDGTTFHRVARGFVIQGGDPTGTGGGGPGYTVVEAPPRTTHYVRGVVAMAKTGAQPAGASGSQFFVVTGADAGLPPDYALAGKVVSGIGVVERIGALQTNPPGDGSPLQPVVMSKVTVSVK